MRWINKGQEWLCLYMAVTDEELGRIKQDKDYYLDRSFVSQCMSDGGDNCVVTMIHKNNTNDTIIHHLKILRSIYKTVSFWNRGHKKFITRRGLNGLQTKTLL
jgi:hypothetical protein